MRDYELTFLLGPTFSEKERDEFVAKVVKWVEEKKGKVEKVDLWGKRTLAYKIKKHLEGIYIFMRLKLGAKEVEELDRKLRLEETVVRHLIVKKE